MEQVTDCLLSAGGTPLDVFALSTHALRGAFEAHGEAYDEMVDNALGLGTGDADPDAPSFEEPEDLSQLKRRAQEYANVLMRMSKEGSEMVEADVAFREAYAFRALQGLILYLEKNWETEDRPREVLVKVFDAASVALGGEEDVAAALREALAAA